MAEVGWLGRKFAFLGLRVLRDGTRVVLIEMGKNGVTHVEFVNVLADLNNLTGNIKPFDATRMSDLAGLVRITSGRDAKDMGSRRYAARQRCRR
jgi:hypothetical protein